MIHVPIFANLTALPIIYVWLSVGTPSLNFSVVFDSGSSDLLLPGASCSTCAGNQTWSPAWSTSGAFVPCSACPPTTNCTAASQCAFTDAFGGIAESAVLASDVVALSRANNAPAARALFGAVTNITAPMRRRKRQSFDYPDGLWGAAFAAIGSTGRQLWDSLRLAASPPLPDVFSHCFGTNGGVLTLGGLSPHVSKPFQFVPITRADFFRFNFVDLAVNGKRLHVPHPVWNGVAAIVDTGTPVVNVPVAAFQALRSAIAALCAAGATFHGFCDAPAGQTLLDGACFAFTSAQRRNQPRFSFLVGDAAAPLELPYDASAFLQQSPYACSDASQLSLALSSPGDNFTVLGASFMTKTAVAYDRARMRLGFAPQHGCPAPTLAFN